MKFGFCMLLWTTSVGESHRALLEDIQATGYDGVELPMFEGTPNDYAAVERMPGGIGPGRTADSVIPSVDKHPLGEDPAVRSTAVDYLKSCVDCPAALAADSLDDPLHQTLGHFPGSPLTEAEFERAREFHGEVGNYAAASQVTIALEAVNRFESYFATAMDQLGSFVANLGHLAIRAMYDTFRANIDEADPIVASSRNSEHLVHVHISKSDRGTPGRGHVPWARTFAEPKSAKYDRWLTIEAFGQALPELAAAARIWRDVSDSPEACYREGYRCMREGWDAA